VWRHNETVLAAALANLWSAPCSLVRTQHCRRSGSHKSEPLLMSHTLQPKTQALASQWWWNRRDL
jgi:hypothetical protein